tara:strand:- start:1760 stop:2944 length:1185 start_codon:yes stop_codon:yes gene_type:complete
VEDTNAELSKPELIDNIYRSLDWLEIDFDGEPVRQSQRADLYDDAVEQWISAGVAYEDQGAIRFRVPQDGTTSWDDQIRGAVVFENQHIEDFVVRRADGTATFFTANAVDDLDLGITHVVRGEDLVNVTPKVILLREALGESAPLKFAHLPLIINEQRKKLSKRRDDVALEAYRERGILPTAMVNYLALLGWGPKDDVEVRPISEIIEMFDIADVNPSAAMFDVKKLEAINGEYIRALSPEEFGKSIAPWLEEEDWAGNVDDEVLRQVAPLVQERTRVLAEAPKQLDFFFWDNQEMDSDAWQKVMLKDSARSILEAARSVLADVEWNVEALHEAVRKIAESHELKLGKAQAPIRVAITGRTVGPPLFESMYFLGREVVVERLGNALQKLVEAQR